MTHRTHARRDLALVVLVAFAAVGALGGGIQRAKAADPRPPATVIVLEEATAGTAPELAVGEAGGRVVRQLPAINGFVAALPTDAIARIQGTPGVLSVTPNTPVHFNTEEYDAAADQGSMLENNEAIGADLAQDRSQVGSGIDVAIIDTGVSRVRGLDASGKVVHGPDLSFDSQDPLSTNVDLYGHGTHIAGIIAGSDSGSYNDRAARQKQFFGVAPGARIVSVKVGDANGMADVSQVLAAIDWVVQHRNSNGLRIKVLNLALGTWSTQPYTVDPLAYAVEVAWNKGIVVVAAAGNGGSAAGRLDDPAYDPFIIAVGADHPKGTPEVNDDEIAEFSSRGDGVRNPDLVAPGKGVQSLRVAGSTVDTQFPMGRINGRYFRGSGTSQAAAVVSGVAAVVLAERPSLTPDQVKALLVKTAVKLPNEPASAQGAGLVNLDRALAGKTPGNRPQGWTAASGTGSLEATRGGIHLVDNATGVELSGEQDIFGKPFDSGAWARRTVSGAWDDLGYWNGTQWIAPSDGTTSFSGIRWSSSAWSGTTWEGIRWSGVRWSGVRWSGVRWSSAGADPGAGADPLAPAVRDLRMTFDGSRRGVEQRDVGRPGGAGGDTTRTGGGGAQPAPPATAPSSPPPPDADRGPQPAAQQGDSPAAAQREPGGRGTAEPPRREAANRDAARAEPRSGPKGSGRPAGATPKGDGPREPAPASPAATDRAGGSERAGAKAEPPRRQRAPEGHAAKADAGSNVDGRPAGAAPKGDGPREPAPASPAATDRGHGSDRASAKSAAGKRG